MEILGVQAIYVIPIMLGVIISTGGILRHFWIKTQCFYLMKQRQEHFDEQQEKFEEDFREHIDTERKARIDIYESLKKIEIQQAKIETMLNAVIKKD